MSLKYEPSSEPLHISAKWLGWGAYVHGADPPNAHASEVWGRALSQTGLSLSSYKGRALSMNRMQRACNAKKQGCRGRVIWGAYVHRADTPHAHALARPPAELRVEVLLAVDQLQLVELDLLLAFFHVVALGFRVQGSGCRVQGSGFRVQGAGFRVQG